MSRDFENDKDAITPPHVYFHRRALMRAGLMAGSAVGTAALYRRFNRPAAAPPETAQLPIGEQATDAISGEGQLYSTDEPLTSLRAITNYNNFYEFSTSKEGVARAAANFTTEDWQLSVEGLVHAPTVFGLEALLRLGPPEERIYRLRCVEAWSMVIPWIGFPLSRLLEIVQPRAEAKYVAFETLYDPQRMPGQRTTVLPWPYVEGLRLDEAMHPLTILATGLYGRALPPQDGAPIRLVVPWKYGFKGIKSIVKISLVAEQPETTWNRAAPHEYGFYANVNPIVAHPRWSQATEQRIGESGRRRTLPFNGYEDQVAGLYADMDLRANY
jgi:methionine sulfoxide reductase catalytic subunit